MSCVAGAPTAASKGPIAPLSKALLSIFRVADLIEVLGRALIGKEFDRPLKSAARSPSTDLELTTMNHEALPIAIAMPLFAIKVHRSADHPCGAAEAWCRGCDGYPLVFRNLRDAEASAMRFSALLCNPMIWYTAVQVQDHESPSGWTRTRRH